MDWEVGVSASHFEDMTGVAMEALRKLTLRTRLAATFDALVHQPSAVRCITIGRGIQESIADPACEEIVRAAGLMQRLREEAVARSKGAPQALPPLLPEPVVRQREVNNGI